MNTTGFEHLLSPVKVGNLTLKNRIFSAPTSLNWLAPDGSLTPETIAYYELKAKGGAAVVTLGESIVHSATGKSHDRQISLDDPNVMVSLAQAAHAIKRHGAVPSAELSHGGKWGGLSSLAGSDKSDKVAYGASDEMTPVGPVKEMPKALLLEIIDSFGKGAAVLKKAGFEMCEVHAAHGWLFGQFLSLRTNHRTDEFGGPIENRAKPLILALEAIRRYAGPNFPIDVRISGAEFIDGGLTLEDGIAVAKLIEDKCDMINVSAGIHEDFELFLRTHPTQFMEKGPNVFLAEAIRKEVKIPISTVGGIVDPELMEEIIAAGKADIVELGRPLLADPYFPTKIRQGRVKEVARCLRCMSCFEESIKTGWSACTVNPVIGNEFNDWIARAQATTPKKVMIAGGGPGGMYAAVTAAERGHEVVLYEKTDKLGGALAFAQHAEFKYGLYEFKEMLEHKLQILGVKVVLNTPVTRELAEMEKPDVLLVANGAAPIIPRIEGIDGENVITAEKVYGNADKCGNSIVVLGGGLVGCETAAYLGRAGKQVTVLEMREDIAMDCEVFYNTAIKVELRNDNVKTLTRTSGTIITGKGIYVKDAEGKESFIEADTIVNAVGYRPDGKLFEEVCNAAPIVNRIGDCRTPGKVAYAVRDAYYMVLDI